MGVHEHQLFPERLSWGTKGGPGYQTLVRESDGGHEVRRTSWQSVDALTSLFLGSQTYDGPSRVRVDVAKSIQSRADYAELLDFYMTTRGAAYGFRFRDWTDWSTHPEHNIAPRWAQFGPLLPTGQLDPRFEDYSPIHIQTGTETEYQCYKVYGRNQGGGLAKRKVTRLMRVGGAHPDAAFFGWVQPFSGSGFHLLPGVNLTLDWSTGRIRIPDNAIASGILGARVPPVGSVIYAAFAFHIPARFDEDADDRLEAGFDEDGNLELSSVPIVEISQDRQTGIGERRHGGWTQVRAEPQTFMGTAYPGYPVDIYRDGSFIEVASVTPGSFLLLPDTAPGAIHPREVTYQPRGGPVVTVWNASGTNLPVARLNGVTPVGLDPAVSIGADQVAEFHLIAANVWVAR